MLTQRHITPVELVFLSTSCKDTQYTKGEKNKKYFETYCKLIFDILKKKHVQLFKEDGKTKNIKARYTVATKEKVKEYMNEKQRELIQQLTLQFD